MLSEEQWEKAQQKVTVAWHRKDFAAAFAEIDHVLSSGTDQMKGQALIYRGLIRDSQGDANSARRDWLEAIAFTPPGSYGRYVAQRSVADACSQIGLEAEALDWYRAALKTCAEGDDFSGGVALAALVRLSGGRLVPQDESLAEQVARKSWRVLDLPGSADLKDLVATAEALARKRGTHEA